MCCAGLDGSLKISDFGVAKVFEFNENESHGASLQAESQMGTARYTSADLHCNPCGSSCIRDSCISVPNAAVS